MKAAISTVQPRATEHIAEMIAIIERLIAGGHAYAAEGHVPFSVVGHRRHGKQHAPFLSLINT